MSRSIFAAQRNLVVVTAADLSLKIFIPEHVKQTLKTIMKQSFLDKNIAFKCDFDFRSSCLWCCGGVGWECVFLMLTCMWLQNRTKVSKNRMLKQTPW